MTFNDHILMNIENNIMEDDNARRNFNLPTTFVLGKSTDFGQECKINGLISDFNMWSTALNVFNRQSQT